MKILQEVQNNLISMGMNPELERFNRRILNILAINFPGVVSLWIFLFHEANSAEEYLESIYIVTASSGIFLSFASTIFVMEELFSFIKNVDDAVNESKIRKANC